MTWPKIMSSMKLTLWHIMESRLCLYFYLCYTIVRIEIGLNINCGEKQSRCLFSVRVDYTLLDGIVSQIIKMNILRLTYVTIFLLSSIGANSTHIFIPYSLQMNLKTVKEHSLTFAVATQFILCLQISLRLFRCGKEKK